MVSAATDVAAQEKNIEQFVSASISDTDSWLFSKPPRAQLSDAFVKNWVKAKRQPWTGMIELQASAYLKDATLKGAMMYDYNQLVILGTWAFALSR